MTMAAPYDDYDVSNDEDDFRTNDDHDDDEQHLLSGDVDRSRRVNPAIPTTVGGLLAEECMIDPTSSFPSFLEMMMMDDASVSTRRAIATTMESITREANDRWIVRHTGTPVDDENNRNNDNSNNRNNENSNRDRDNDNMSRIMSYIRNGLVGGMVWLGTRWGPEIRFLIHYALEYRSLCSSSAPSTLSESLYGVMRSKVVTRTVVVASSSSQQQLQKQQQQKRQQQQKQKQQQQQHLTSITHSDRFRLAFGISFGPYLYDRLSQFYHHCQKRQRQRQQRQTQQRQQRQTQQRNHDHSPHRLLVTTDDRIQKLQDIFVSVFPFLHMTKEGTLLIYQFLYFVKKSHYFDPLSHLLGLVVRRVTASDLKRAHHPTQPPPSSSSSSPPPPPLQQQQDRTGNSTAAATTATTTTTSSPSTTTIAPPPPPPPPPPTPTTKTVTTQPPAAATNATNGATRIQTFRHVAVLGFSAIFALGWWNQAMQHYRRLRDQQERIREQQQQQEEEEEEEQEVEEELQPPRQQRRQHPRRRHRRLVTATIPPPPEAPPFQVDPKYRIRHRKNDDGDGGDGGNAAATASSSSTKNKILCSLCQQPRIHPAASTSGYVFCHRCLVMHLRQHGEKCPLTSVPCPEHRIVRLYEPAQ